MLYCNILWACRTFGDWARASQWTLGYQQFCTDSRMEFSGSCQLHRAEVLGVQRLAARSAGAHQRCARRACPTMRHGRSATRIACSAIFKAAIGNADAALAAYEKAYALGWNPEPGHAMLLLERGEAEAAFASLERSLIGQSWWTLQRQGMLLAHLALVAAHAGRHEKAQALIDDLAGQEQALADAVHSGADQRGVGVARAQTRRADEALRHLHLARQLWTSIDCRLNAARLRLQIAELQLDMATRAAPPARFARRWLRPKNSSRKS